MDWEKNSLQILNALDNPILVIDRNYRIVAANSAACRSFCLSADKIIGKECFRITHRGDTPCWQKEAHCPAKVTFELKEKTKVIHQHIYAGKTVFEEITAVPIFDSHGEVNFLIEELIDMTKLIESKEMIDYLKNEINTLRGIIPICSSCKNVRNDKGYWQQVETYIHDRSEAKFSHSICPECLEKLYPEFVDRKLENKESESVSSTSALEDKTLEKTKTAK
jgi:PAS domain S-box-containing protein